MIAERTQVLTVEQPRAQGAEPGQPGSAEAAQAACRGRRRDRAPAAGAGAIFAPVLLDPTRVSPREALQPPASPIRSALTTSAAITSRGFCTAAASRSALASFRSRSAPASESSSVRWPATAAAGPTRLSAACSTSCWRFGALLALAVVAILGPDLPEPDDRRRGRHDPRIRSPHPWADPGRARVRPVLAARALGCSHLKIVARHILPTSWRPSSSTARSPLPPPSW